MDEEPTANPLEHPEWEQMRGEWYSRRFVIFEIVKCMAHKETAFLEKKPIELNRRAKVVRCINSWTHDLMMDNFSAFRFAQFPYLNIYHSLMSFEKMPMFSHSAKERRKQQDAWLLDYKDQYIGFDWGIDLDGETIEQAKQDAIKIMDILNEFKIPFYAKFSGSKGFHFSVEHKWLPQLDRELLVPLLADLTTMIRGIDNLPSVDDTIIDDRRIFKAPYSFDRGRIVLPLSDDQLRNFDLSIVDPRYVLKNIIIKDRGLLTRHTDQTPEQARKSFIKMASNYLDKKQMRQYKLC